VHPFRVIKNSKVGVRAENGFTLIEMLAAICISAVLFGVLSEFLFNCAKLWDRQDRAYQKQHQVKLVYQTLLLDLTPLYPGFCLPEGAVQGDERQLRFWRETNAGLVRITYRYDPVAQKVWRSSGFAGSEPKEAELFSDVVGWRFEYYQATTKNWLLQWGAERKLPETVPKLIRVSVRTKLGNLGVLTFPVKAWHLEE
jgi:prepilin-type N-terminal cleavage/methylation domain-containing protein